MEYITRLAVLDDIPSIAEIYNQGIEDRVATLETRLRTVEEMKEWLTERGERHDVIISNCVINLSLDKSQVFKEAFRVLKPGGRLCISDVVATARLGQDIKQDLAMISGCIGGAEHVDDLKKIMEGAGFKDIRMKPKDNSREIIKAWAPGKNIEDYVASFIIEAKK